MVLEPPARDAHAQLRIYGQPEWNLGFEAVTRHPLADDAATLARLGMKPTECLWCDLWWVVRDRLCLVEICSTVDAPRVTFHGRTGPVYGVHFSVTTKTSPLTSATVSAVLRWLDAWIAANTREFSEGVERPVRITESDVARPNLGGCTS